MIYLQQLITDTCMYGISRWADRDYCTLYSQFSLRELRQVVFALPPQGSRGLEGATYGDVEVSRTAAGAAVNRRGGRGSEVGSQDCNMGRGQRCA
jgi:hypothetical protein